MWHRDEIASQLQTHLSKYYYFNAINTLVDWRLRTHPFRLAQQITSIIESLTLLSFELGFNAFRVFALFSVGNACESSSLNHSMLRVQLTAGVQFEFNRRTKFTEEFEFKCHTDINDSREFFIERSLQFIYRIICNRAILAIETALN